MVRSIPSDVEAVARLEAVPTILRVVTETTGLRFSLVARVTQDTWTACAVHDELAFGLKAGGTLDVATTLCSEVRDSHTPIIINHASEDPRYCTHHTPKIYGLESYIAVPIFLTDGSYFGPAAIVNAHRFIFDSRDQGAEERLEILNDREGVWRCRTTFNCTEACPRGIEVTKAIQEVKRALLARKI